MGCTGAEGLEGRLPALPKEEEVEGLLLQLLEEWELGPREDEDEEEDRLLPKLEEWELEWEELEWEE